MNKFGSIDAQNPTSRMAQICAEELTDVPIKEYLGDSVYATIDDGGLILTTENGMGPNNTIYIDPDVYESLIKFVQRMEERKKVNDAKFKS